MAPQYAPSLRSRLAPLLLFIQIGFIFMFYFCIEIDNNINANETPFREFYAEYQDVNVMVIAGFGFLSAFPVRYSFSSCGFNLLVAAVSTQWAIILNGIDSWFYRGKIRVNLKSLVVAEMCALSALISIGALMGKANPVQLVLMGLLEVSGFVLNKWLLQTLLEVPLFHSIMLLHIFGAFFGLTVTWLLYRPASEQPLEKEKLGQKTGLFSFFGTLLLWMFWPSFNSILVDHRLPGRKLSAVCATYLALAVSAVTSAGVSMLSSPQGKVNPVQLQSCIFAVALGISLPVVREPWEAMTIGFLAAAMSSAGYSYLKAYMVLALKCHDTCAVLSTHAVPGLFGWMAHLLLQIRDSDDHTMAIRFAVFHISGLLITIAMSLAMGVITGVILKANLWRPPQDRKCFDDQAYWVFPNLAVRK
ncbi:rh blood group, D antigen [Synchiropus splendidus]|uniref:rh blood group, D antigen n=1 Tax=Synchiropus splendidus TaxID=270530 RepID=UPI00237DC4FF|nr:rh blood group, D antigen [Synchiropus splendidus]